MTENGLYVVATPIGNLEDISQRAVRILGEVSLIAAEDTRHTGILLRHLDISTPVTALHEHNEERELPALLQRLSSGAAIALVSDAGTPLVSDPGFRLVRAARQAGLPVFAVPGPSALTAALSVTGLPTDRFCFEGFLPAKEAARRKRIEALNNETRTLVFFEASHRVLECLIDLAELLGGGREAAVCRELTKRFETVLSGSLAELVERVGGDPDQRRGEFVLVVGGCVQVMDADLASAVTLARTLLEFLPPSQAARAAAQVTGLPRRQVFEAISRDE
jgi:16S rRNA (cytidine1402-2'-O)-methyltransferase